MRTQCNTASLTVI